jgi:hypothetical protein
MTPARYKSLRKSLGTVPEVAMMLGVSRAVVHRREGGATITPESALALTALALRRVHPHCQSPAIRR